MVTRGGKLWGAVERGIERRWTKSTNFQLHDK